MRKHPRCSSARASRWRSCWARRVRDLSLARREELPQKAEAAANAFQARGGRAGEGGRAEATGFWQKMAAAGRTTIRGEPGEEMVERSWNRTVEAGRT